MCARASAGLRIDECHDILELIAEAVGAAALVQRRPAPHPAGEGLVQRPPIEHHVERGLRRPHLDHGQSVGPGRDGPRDGRRRARSRRGTPRPRAGPHLPPPLRRARRPARGSRPAAGPAHSAARRTDRCRHPWCRRAWCRKPAGAAAVPFRPRNSRRSAVWSATGSLMAQKATWSANWGSKKFRAKIACRSGSKVVCTWCWVCSRSAPRVHSTKAVTARRRGAAAQVGDAKQRQLDGFVLGQAKDEGGGEAGVLVLERRAARPVTTV